MIPPLPLVILLAPVLGALIILCLPSQRPALIRRVSVAAMGVSLEGAATHLDTHRADIRGYQH